MPLAHRHLRTLILLGLAMTPPACVSPAAADDITSVAAGRPQPLPVVTEHRYRMMARVRPLLFWISRDDVGGARITWRGNGSDATGLELLIGSDPAKAPRHINKWGYVSEEVRGNDAHLLGVMKQSNDTSIEDAQAEIAADGHDYVFKAISGAASTREAQAQVTTVRAPRDFTYHDLEPLLQLLGSARNTGTAKSIAMVPGTRPGFLLALAELIAGSVDASHAVRGASMPRTIPYVYNGSRHELTLRKTDFRRSVQIGGRQFADVVHAQFETRSLAAGETTRFELAYGTAGPLAGVPVHAIYQPRWWFEVQLFLDETMRF